MKSRLLCSGILCTSGVVWSGKVLILLHGCRHALAPVADQLSNMTPSETNASDAGMAMHICHLTSECFQLTQGDCWPDSQIPNEDNFGPPFVS